MRYGKEAVPDPAIVAKVPRSYPIVRKILILDYGHSQLRGV